MFGRLLNLMRRNLSQPTILNLYQYKFLRYKKIRKEKYPLKLERIRYDFKQGLVSIVLPVHNGSYYIEECVECILNQSYRNFELIIVNDASTDDTKEIIGRFERRDERVRIINTGKRIDRANCLSLAFREANGEFMTWTSFDHIMLDNYIEKMVRELQCCPSAAMVYGNMKVIDSKGKVFKKHNWYEKPARSGNVILPGDTLELNTYANNTIGAAFMYRGVVTKLIGDYLTLFPGLEDYDYWMKINSLFDIRHTGYSETLYLYRLGGESEKAVVDERPALIVYDDFRNDFYLSPLIWYIDYAPDQFEAAKEFKQCAEASGHMCISANELNCVMFNSSAHNLVYINFGKCEVTPQRGNSFNDIINEVENELTRLAHSENAETSEKNPQDTENKNDVQSNSVDDSETSDISSVQEAAKHVYIPEGTIKFYIGDDLTEDLTKLEQKGEEYSAYVTLSENGEIPAMPDNKGSFAMRDIQNLFSFLDIKARMGIIANMERPDSHPAKSITRPFKISNGGELRTFIHSKKVSVIVCVCKLSRVMIECVKALCEQDFPADDFEIIYVNNDYMNMKLARVYEVFTDEYPHLNIKYVSAPVQGLSYARNAGMHAAEGEILLYIDDDAVAEPHWIMESYNCFRAHPKAGVIGGQVVLELPEPRPAEVPEGLESLWHELKMNFGTYKESIDYTEFPYGANFGVRRQSLYEVGGFRTRYGRTGDDYKGGEEMAVCFMMEKIGMTVGLNPRSIVIHKIDPERFSFKYIENTVIQNIATQYRLRMDLYAPQDWSADFMEERAIKAARELHSIPENTARYVHKAAEKDGFTNVLKKLDRDYDARHIT